MAKPLRVGYVPEHFSTPLQFAHADARSPFDLLPYPAGTGTMIEAFQRSEIDVGVGLTEAWVAGIAKERAASTPPQQSYRIISEYVKSPLRWAVITGGQRNDVGSVEDLKGSKVGVSRMGSGSHIMSTVLADDQGWYNATELPFEIVVCGAFPSLLDAVNSKKVDSFMWEHFTTKKWFDSGQLKKIGEIATPWNGWHIAIRNAGVDQNCVDVLEKRVRRDFLPDLLRGLKEFRELRHAVVQFNVEQLGYNEPDVEEWYREVVYPEQFGYLNKHGLRSAVKGLSKVGLIGDSLGRDHEVLKTLKSQ